MSPAGTAVRVLVAGTAGGVGTTTVAALLFSGMSTFAGPQLVDHTGGELGRRLPSGDDVAQLDPTRIVHDLGAHATTAVDLLGDTSVLLVAVVAATPAGLADAERLLAAVRGRHGASGLRRTVVAAVGVGGRHGIRGTVSRLHDAYGQRTIVELPTDAALAAGGRLAIARANGATQRAHRQLLTYVQERLDGFGGAPVAVTDSGFAPRG